MKNAKYRERKERRRIVVEGRTKSETRDLSNPFTWNPGFGFYGTFVHDSITKILHLVQTFFSDLITFPASYSLLQTRIGNEYCDFIFLVLISAKASSIMPPCIIRQAYANTCLGPSPYVIPHLRLLVPAPSPCIPPPQNSKSTNLSLHFPLII
jgi:hypothetical protein